VYSWYQPRAVGVAAPEDLMAWQWDKDQFARHCYVGATRGMRHRVPRGRGHGSDRPDGFVERGRKPEMMTSGIDAGFVVLAAQF